MIFLVKIIDLIFSKLPFKKKDFFRNIVRVSNCLDPDLTHSVQGEYLSDCDDVQVNLGLHLTDSSFCWFCICMCVCV